MQILIKLLFYKKEDLQKKFKESVEALKAGHQNETDMCPQDIITLDETSAAEIDDLQAEYITVSI